MDGGRDTVLCRIISPAQRANGMVEQDEAGLGTKLDHRLTDADQEGEWALIANARPTYIPFEAKCSLSVRHDSTSVSDPTQTWAHCVSAENGWRSTPRTRTDPGDQLLTPRVRPGSPIRSPDRSG